jgi:hypothetical protein
LALIILYVVIDPYKKIWNYKLYRSDYVMLNRGDVSTMVYLKNKKEYNFNSFIFGSSRSCAFTSKEWTKYLSKGSLALSYGSWNETIQGICNKLALLDSLNAPINNVLMIFDVDDTFNDLKWDPLSDDHYLISKKKSYDYHLSAIINYYKDPLLIITSIDYSLFHTRRNYMKNFVTMKDSDLDPVNNDWFPNSEQEIMDDSVKYYLHPIDTFYLRTKVQHFEKKYIVNNKLDCLIKIKAILKKRNSNCKIVISPLYYQIKLNTDDLNTLNQIFGKDNVFDYSGINYLTDNKYNFANDVIHYRKRTANIILKEIYSHTNKQ